MRLRSLSLVTAAFTLMSFAAQASVIWQRMEGSIVPATGERQIVPEKYLVFTANESTLKTTLDQAGSTPEDITYLTLPMPDGTLKNFRVWHNSLMAQGLAVKYPEIQTLTGVATDNERITAKIDYTLRGFHAMIFDGANTSFVDPYSNQTTGYYISYYRSDYSRDAGTLMHCSFNSNNAPAAAEGLSGGSGLPEMALKTINGNVKRTYRLALACTGEYARAIAGATPTKPVVLSAMVTSMNRVNGVYERELAVSMQLVSNTDQLIYLDGTTDPYTNNDGSAMLSENQATVTSVIGSANYDIGHVFSTGGGGIAQISSICRSSSKAMGVTGSPTPRGDAYDIDFVAHEIGHQFGSDHTFNNNINGSCEDNAAAALAYEPGSGSTIMAYAGICSPDNIQTHSDAYFHAKSLANITNTITASGISTCAVATTSGNKAVFVAPFTASYNIPYKTPFELTAPVIVDSVATTDNTYCWEQWNLGDFGLRFSNTFLKGPIFRSFSPDTSRTRVFPALSRILANVTSYLGEKVPDTGRYLTFKLTARSFANGIGSMNIPDDTIHLNVINTGVPFLVTSPNTFGITWAGASNQTITWNVANTTAAPVSCAAVDIFLSADGGYTYPYTLQSGAPNNGSATVMIPNIATTTARIKVKGSGNVFFDLSNYNLTIIRSTTDVAGTTMDQDIKVYPVPATDELMITTAGKDKIHVSMTDQVGRTVLTTTLVNAATLPVRSLARGIYYLKMSNEQDGRQLTKKITLQ